MDSDLLSVLYKQYAPAVFFYALSLTRNREAAEDLTADAFEKAFLTPELATGAGFKSWLFTVCRNLWIDRIRREKHFPRADYASIEELTSSRMPDEEFFADERSRRIVAHIISLPGDYGKILILHYYGNLSLAEIAKVLGITPGAAKTALYRARIKLKLLMEEHKDEF